jgi:glycosyltransferase involved in cell wall biosynthesis
MQLDTAQYLHAADIFCLRSRYEALPLSIPEAYRAGLLVVVSSVGGSPEIVEHEQTGLLVPKESAESLAAALNRLISDPEGRRKMSAKASELGHSQRFEPEVTHGMVEDLYEDVRANPPPRSPPTAFEASVAVLMRSPLRASL